MKINLEELEVVEDFGKNDIYESVLAIKEPEKIVYFVKKTNKSILEDENRKKYFENEVYVNENIDHENIVKFLEKKQILNDTYLIFESANGGNLEDCFKTYQEKNKKPFTEEIVQNIISQIAAALKYLHDSHIVYRNLSLNHIYLDYDSEEDRNNMNLLKVKIKIGNFHFSKVLGENELAHSFIGTPVYMDPNILFSNENQEVGYEYRADVWALGTLCYELLNGKTPFDGNDVDELANNIKTEKYKIPKKLNLSKEAVSFISGMLQYNPNKRFDIDDVLKQDFLTKKVNEFSHKDYEKLGEVKDDELIISIDIN
jgi:serine/threonine protein kinase